MANPYQWKNDAIKAVDPYEDWLLDSGAGYGFPFGPPNEGHCYSGTEASGSFSVGDENPDAIYPKLYDLTGFTPKFRPFVLKDIGTPQSNGGAGVIKRRLGVPLRAASLNSDFDPAASVAAPVTNAASKVVIGVIDDGIAIAHRRFQAALGESRIDFAWVQDGDNQLGSNVAYGREYLKSDIDGAIDRHTDDHGATSETALYRDLGLTDSGRVMPNSLDNRAAHGTHVLDLAAGGDYESDPSLGEDRIISVQVPAAVTWDTSGMGLDSFILAGVHYILDRADQISAGIPVVINFSYGLFGGPQDGTSLLERAIDEIVTARNAAGKPTSVVLPSGNHHLERSHAVLADGDFTFTEPAGSVVPTGHCDLPWRVQPNDRTSSYLEVWMPKGTYAEGDIELEVIPPSTEDIPTQRFAASVNGATLLTRKGKTIARLSYDRHTPLAGEDERGRFTFVLAPTEVRNDQGGQLELLKAAPHGLWTIRVIKTSDKALDSAIHARIQRDASPFGFPALGRQPYFDDVLYELYDKEGKLQEQDNNSIVKRAGSSNGLATGAVPIVVAGHVEATGKAAIYSGYKPDRQSPLVSAESDRSPVFRGVRAAGVRSGVSVVLDGTSVAAPTITRKVAGYLKAGEDPMHMLETDAAAIEAERQNLGHFTSRNPVRQGKGRFPKDALYGS